MRPLDQSSSLVGLSGHRGQHTKSYVASRLDKNIPPPLVEQLLTVAERVRDRHRSPLESLCDAHDQLSLEPIILRPTGVVEGPFEGFMPRFNSDRVVVKQSNCAPRSGQSKIVTGVLEDLHSLLGDAPKLFTIGEEAGGRSHDRELEPRMNPQDGIVCIGDDAL